MEPQEFQLQIPVDFDSEENDELPRRAVFKHRRKPRRIFLFLKHAQSLNNTAQRDRKEQRKIA